MKKRLILTVCFLLWATLYVAATGTETCIMKGTVTDAQGKPIAGAVVEFTGTGIGTHYSTKTDKSGFYIQVGVRAGIYRVTVSKDGQQLWVLEAYEVAFGSSYRPEAALGAAGKADSSYEHTLNIAVGKGMPSASAPPLPLTAPQKLALEELQKQAAAVTKKDPHEITNRLKSAQMAQKAGDWEKVIADLTEVTRMDPMHDGAWAAMGYAYLQTGKFDLAVPALEKAVAIKSGVAIYHSNLAIAYARAGKVDEAVTEFDTTAQADPGSAAKYYYYAGAVLSDRDRSKDAVTAFDKAIAADPKMADAYYWKGVNLMRQATYDAGKLSVPAGTADALKKYLELDPSGKFASEAQQRLARLGG